MAPAPQNSPIAGSVLPIQRAEELLSTLPGVVSARIIAAENGAVDGIHVLTTVAVSPKQTVRNIESALIAHLGMRVDHRKISVATTSDAPRGFDPRPTPASVPVVPEVETKPVVKPLERDRRRLYFDDVEVRRSRTKGVACRVTLRKGEETFVGEADGIESERSRVDLAARATLTAIAMADPADRVLSLEGVKLVDAFERHFAFVGVTARQGRETTLLTGSCEIKDSAETAAALAILDATNRWMGVAGE